MLTIHPAQTILFEAAAGAVSAVIDADTPVCAA
jgi:hypothetical protein